MLSEILKILPMLVCLFWGIAIFITLCERRKRHYGVLTLFMANATLLYWGLSIYYNRIALLIPVSDTVYTFCNLAIYPLFLCYIKAVTTSGQNIYITIVRWMLPSFLCAVIVAWTYMYMTDEEIQIFLDSCIRRVSVDTLDGMPFRMSILHIVRRLVFVIQIPFVIVIGLRHIRRFNRLVVSLYADTEQRSIMSIHVILYLFLGISVLSFIFNILGAKVFVSSEWIRSVPMFMFSALLYGFGYIGHRHNFSFEDIEHDIKGTTGFVDESGKVDDEQQDENIMDIVVEGDNESAVQSNEQTSELRQRIERLMIDEKLYLTPNLKLVDLVKMLGTNRSYVYNAINREMGMSFSEYVNSLRVKYACELMQRDPSLSIPRVAEQSGFASDVSFYRNFKLFKGGSPKDYFKNKA